MQHFSVFLQNLTIVRCAEILAGGLGQETMGDNP